MYIGGCVQVICKHIEHFTKDLNIPGFWYQGVPGPICKNTEGQLCLLKSEIETQK